MELLQLRYFAELAKRENLSKTAEYLMISAPSLSSTIKRLEKEVGTPLFDRTQYTIHLNEDGKRFLHYVTSALNTLDYGIASLASGRKSILKLALTNFLIWSELIYEFESLHPDIQVEYSLISLEEINDRSRPFPWNFFLGVIEDVEETLFQSHKVYVPEEPVVRISRLHPLANRTSVRLDELKNERFISTKMSNASAHQYMISLCQLAGFKPKNIYYADYLMLSKLLEQNRGINIATMVGWNRTTVASDKITVIPISYPIITRTQAVNWRRERQLTPVEVEFLNFAGSYFVEHPLIADRPFSNEAPFVSE